MNVMYLIATVCGTAPHAALRYHLLAHADLVSLACCTYIIRSVSCLRCALTVRHRCCSNCQDKLDPSKDDDVILALIIAAASSKHRNSKRMQSLQQRVLVSLLMARFCPLRVDIWKCFV